MGIPKTRTSVEVCGVPLLVAPAPTTTCASGGFWGMTHSCPKAFSFLLQPRVRLFRDRSPLRSSFMVEAEAAEQVLASWLILICLLTLLILASIFSGGGPLLPQANPPCWPSDPRLPSALRVLFHPQVPHCLAPLPSPATKKEMPKEISPSEKMESYMFSCFLP